MTTNNPIGPPDGTVSLRYTGFATFARLPRLTDLPSKHADIVVAGVPFDSGVSYRPGARFGPAHIRESSRLLRLYNPEVGVYPFAAQQVADAGDIDANPFDIQEAIRQIQQGAHELTENRTRLISMGGDHTIALPLLRVAAERAGKPVAVLHFDAHLDTWDTYLGAPYTHGTPFRRASEEGLIDLTASTHVGIRGPIYSKDDLRDDKRLGFAVISCADIELEGLQRAIDRMLTRLRGHPVYLSIDVDVLDPAHSPGTGTPEAGGMTSRELLTMIRALREMDLVGADIVEMLPAYDHAQITGVAASHMIFEILSVMALQKD